MDAPEYARGRLALTVWLDAFDIPFSINYSVQRLVTTADRADWIETVRNNVSTNFREIETELIRIADYLSDDRLF